MILTRNNCLQLNLFKRFLEELVMKTVKQWDYHQNGVDLIGRSCSVLPVSPPSVRPSVRQGAGLRSEDDITHKLIDIIKTNNHLKRK